MKGSSKILKELFFFSLFVNTFAYFMNNWGEINLSPFEPPNLLPPSHHHLPSSLFEKYYSPHFLSSIDRASRNLKENKQNHWSKEKMEKKIIYFDDEKIEAFDVKRRVWKLFMKIYFFVIQVFNVFILIGLSNDLIYLILISLFYFFL